jgi:hypothetical protein
VSGSARVKITLLGQLAKGRSKTDEAEPRPTLEAVLTSPLARAVSATLGFFFLRQGVNAGSGLGAVTAMLAGALFFWFCVSGRLPLRFRR